MAAMHGSAVEFDPGKEEWDSYVERLEHYFVANSVAEPQRRSPRNRQRALSMLTELVQCHHNPKPSAIEPTYRDGVPVEYGSLFGTWSWNFETKGGEV